MVHSLQGPLEQPPFPLRRMCFFSLERSGEDNVSRLECLAVRPCIPIRSRVPCMHGFGKTDSILITLTLRRVVCVAW